MDEALKSAEEEKSVCSCCLLLLLFVVAFGFVALVLLLCCVGLGAIICGYLWTCCFAMPFCCVCFRSDPKGVLRVFP